jgi:rfaE bifunctional protein kinase chain/domain
MDFEKLKKILDNISSVKIAVTGDFCLDAYWFIDDTKSEISIETGQKTHPVSGQSYSLGGAGNVTANLAAIGAGEVHAFGVIGDDLWGGEMKKIMTASGIRSDNLIVQQHGWMTHTYAKPYIGDTELSRVDFGNLNVLSEETGNLLLENLEKSLPDLDLVIINQQVPSGIHTESFRKKLLTVIAKHADKLFITDSRNYNDFFDGSLRKMNDNEALRLCGIKKEPDDIISLAELEPAARDLFNRYGKPLFITRGSRGSMIIESDGIVQIPGLQILGKVDTVGAGDSYLAGAASALAAGFGMEDAAYLGTFVAGVTVQKLFQTGTASPAEILSIGKDPDFNYNYDLASDLELANYLTDTNIEIINSWSARPKIGYAIFDHDGTISTLREGWEKIMAPVMVKAVLGEKHKSEDPALLEKVNERVQDYIDKTTGIQTLVQMHGLVSIIREFGFVPENKILDAAGYKKIYNDELLKMVHDREKQFMSGELTIDDFTICRSVDFLKVLYESGVRLYLASGTDIEDVAREAKLLGYDKYFEGRIFGSVGDMTKDAKKIVLDQILDSIDKTGNKEIITFGDGPVEIRETKKRGGLTVGVASDEIVRSGLNKSKRSRLIKAGADIVIPDFSEYENIIKLLDF